MSTNNIGNIHLSKGAIKYLESQNLVGGGKLTLEVDFILQIERCAKNNGGMYNCTLIDSDSKYGGFLLQYDQKDGTPGTGDIIHVSKIVMAKLPTRDSHIYYCKIVKLIRRAMALQVDPGKVVNISKKRMVKEYENTVYKPNESYTKDTDNREGNSYDSSYDDSKCTLISSLTSFTNNALLYLKCKVKNQVKYFVAKQTKKDCILQSYIFVDTKGDEIQATVFGKTAENFDKIIEEGVVYEIKKCSISMAERNYNPTKCDYKLMFYESSQIKKVPDNGKFGAVKFNILPIEQIMDYPIGKLVDVFGIILEDKGFQEFTTKTDKVLKNRKLIIGDETLYKIDLTIWEPLANPEDNYTVGDLIAVKNCRVREFNGRKNIGTTESSEIKNSLDSVSDKKLRSFFNSHQNISDYKEVPGESLSPGTRNIAELVFIKEIMNTYELEMENKDRPVFELCGVVTRLNHSERNYYVGCVKCKKKMEADVCVSCSCPDKKIIFTLSVNVRDASSNFWVDMFGDIAEKFLGVKGEEYEEILRHGNTPEENNELSLINERIEYHTFSFVGKVRENIYNEQKRFRFSAFRFTERNPSQKHSITKYLAGLLK